METIVERIAWRRGGVRHDFVGSVRAGADGIRLTGRDTHTGLDVALSIPSAEVAEVHVAPINGHPADMYVVLELTHAQPIFLREVGRGPFHAQLLARRLGAALHAPRLVAQGG